MKFIDEYFETARERYQILLNRRNSKPKPWTDDPIFQDWRFCNVHREDDKTTVWFRERVRSRLSGLDAIKATIAFRWFNRIETGAQILDYLHRPYMWNRAEISRRLTGVSPVVTGAYVIKTPDGLSKLEGVLQCIEWAFDKLDHDFKNYTQRGRFTSKHGELLNVTSFLDNGLAFIDLRGAWKYLTTFPYLGGFMAYEIVSDLRWTFVLAEADDKCTWANAGPGCARGLSRVVEGSTDLFNSHSKTDQHEMQAIMRDIVSMSQDRNFWPQTWPSWEMREAEHWSCEFDKYMRVAGGERMKQKFNGR
jgi:hypothetical protein